MSFVLLSCLAKSRGHISEFPTYDVDLNSEFPISSHFMSPNRSRYAIMSVYATDNREREVAQRAVMLGYQLGRMCPTIDRILLVSETLQMRTIDTLLLGRNWDLIIRIPHVTFPCKATMRIKKDREYWFKLNVFRYPQYEKILYLGVDTILIKDPTPIFDFPAPAAPLDFQIWDVSEFGPVLNTDFLLLSPSRIDYIGLIKTACDWLPNPEHPSRRLRSTDIGAFDNGVIQEYFNGNITTLPTWWHIELDTKVFDSSYFFNPLVVSYRLTNSKIRNGGYASAAIIKAYNDLVDEIRVITGDRFFTHKSTSLERLLRLHPEKVEVSLDDIRMCFTEFGGLTAKSLMVRCFFITLASWMLVMSSFRLFGEKRSGYL